MKIFTITKNEENIRFDKFLKKLFPNMPNNMIYKMLRKKNFELNKKKVEGKELLQVGDEIGVFLSDTTYEKFAKDNVNDVNKKENLIKVRAYSKTWLMDEFIERVKKSIVYEDENIIIYDKERGLLSQDDKKVEERILLSVNSILKCYIKYNKIDNKEVNGNNKINLKYEPSVVNRLDRNTKGLIIFTKTYVAARAITKMIKEERLQKYYITVVNGIIKKKDGELVHLYRKDEEKNIAIIQDLQQKSLLINRMKQVKLLYKVIDVDDEKNTTKLFINLITGKSHQIRAQFAYIGYPLVCDKKYIDRYGDKNLYIENIKNFGRDSYELRCVKIVFGEFENATLKYLNNKEFGGCSGK